MTRLSRTALGLVAAGALAFAARAGAEIAAAPPQPAAAKVPVVYRGEELFSLACSLGSYPVSDRAAGIVARLHTVAEDPAFDPAKIATTNADIGTSVVVGARPLLTVTDCDAAAEGVSRAALAAAWAARVRGALEKRREEYSGTHVKVAVRNTVLATAALVLVVFLYRRLRPAFYRRLDAWESRFSVTRLRFYASLRRATLLVVRLAFAWLFVLAVIGWLLLVLGELPWTAGSARTIVSWAVKPLNHLGSALVAYLPSLFFLLVIVLVAWGVIRLLRLFFEEVGAGNIPLAGFDREWAPSTYKIVRFVVLAFALVAAFPYIPGSSSEAFKGISIVLGVLVSFASSSAIGNVFAGLTLTYTKAFRVGDWVRIGEAYGDVTETTLLVTRIRTIKNVAITIPNSSVLSSQVHNYTTALSQGGLRLHTSVTIGYDAPWRKVHGLLIDAARRTKGVVASPAPFVLQRELNDFFVTYEINAYVDDPPRMVDILSDLHEAIQDSFNEGGVEIMSPHYASVRDGNAVTIPPEKRPPGYVAPPFRVTVAGDFPAPAGESSAPRRGPTEP
jgi:small-conductance mechanosensitive channel